MRSSRVSANGGVYDYSVEALNQASPEQLWSYAHGGKIPAGLEGIITPEKAKAKLQGDMRSAFVEINPAIMVKGDTYGQGVITAIQASKGDFGKALHKRQLEMLRAGATNAELRDEAQKFATKAATLTGIATGQGALGVKGALELYTANLEEVRGRGVGLVGQSEGQKAAAGENADITREEGGEATKAEQEMINRAGKGAAKKIHEELRKSKPTFTGLPGATDDLVFALNAFKSAVVSSSSGGNSPGRVTPAR